VSAPEHGGVGRASVIMASGTVVSRLLGFISAVVLAQTIGTVGAGADAFALANNVLGRTSYVAAPFLVAALAERTPWSVAVSLTALGPLLALAVILAKLPETRGRELEDTARV